MTEEAIEKFDPNKVVDKVRERIRSTIVELIPEEQWQRLIASELDDILYGKKDPYNSNCRRGESVLAPMIRDEPTKIYVAKIRETLDTPEWREVAINGGKTVGPRLEELIRDVAPTIIGTILTGALSSVVSQMGVQLTNVMSSITYQEQERLKQQRGY